MYTNSLIWIFKIFLYFLIIAGKNILYITFLFLLFLLLNHRSNYLEILINRWNILSRFFWSRISRIPAINVLLFILLIVGKYIINNDATCKFYLFSHFIAVFQMAEYFEKGFHKLIKQTFFLKFEKVLLKFLNAKEFVGAHFLFKFWKYFI